MIRPVVGVSELVAKWVQQQLPDRPDFGQCTAIGIAEDKRLIAGVVFHNYTDYRGHRTIETSIAALDPRWCNRGILRMLFAYPFAQLKVRRLQTTVAKRNKRARRFVTRLGFKLEGIGREGWFSGGDCVVYSMLPRECVWLKEKDIG